jgi:hypothetical protein
MPVRLKERLRLLHLTEFTGRFDALDCSVGKSMTGIQCPGNCGAAVRMPICCCAHKKHCPASHVSASPLLAPTQREKGILP